MPVHKKFQNIKETLYKLVKNSDVWFKTSKDASFYAGHGWKADFPTL